VKIILTETTKMSKNFKVLTAKALGSGVSVSDFTITRLLPSLEGLSFMIEFKGVDYDVDVIDGVVDLRVSV
jgi:hypothetical protein